MKLLISDFEWAIGVLRIGDFPNPKNTNSQIEFINWSFYHQLVISTFSSLVLENLKSNHQLLIKLQIGEFEYGIGDSLNLKTPIPNSKSQIGHLITNWSFPHLVL